MTTPTLEPRDRAAKTRSARTTTGITVDCTCGATNVPLGWGWRLYKHVKAEPYRGKAARGAKCLGPRDLFALMLRESELMLTAPGLRMPTAAEADEIRRKAALPDGGDSEAGQGSLF